MLQCHVKRPLSRVLGAAQMQVRRKNTKLKEVEVLDEAITLEANLQREEEIERKRNKSGLRESDYRKLHGQMPYEEPSHWTHSTVRYQRKLYGVYGAASPIDPRICWMDKEELASKLEYDKLAEDKTIQEMIAIVQQNRNEEKEKIRKRDEDMARNVEKIENWKRELEYKVAKKSAEAEAAKAKKEKLIEEVRRHFGFKVDPKDERFKEMLEKKEKEVKKAEKAAKKSVKDAKMLELLQQQAGDLHKSGKTNKQPGKTGNEDTVSSKSENVAKKADKSNDKED